MRLNKVKTIQGLLAIEGNSLDLDQITAISEGKRILRLKKDIIAVNNAIVTDQFAIYFFNPFQKKLIKKI